MNYLISLYIRYRINKILKKDEILKFKSIIFTPVLKDSIFSVQNIMNNFTTINELSLLFYFRNSKSKYTECKEPCENCDGCDQFCNKIIKL